jgi:NAD(P)-dependent dehydrogenase (short-subunit alcohol dehydrogenase family)
MDVNVKGVLLCCQAIPSMRARKSRRIINIASIAGRQGRDDPGSLRGERDLPGHHPDRDGQEQPWDRRSGAALGAGDGTQTAWHALVGLALFFASDQSAFVTGQSLNVCGGIYFH